MTAMINLVQYDQQPRTVSGLSGTSASYWLPALVTVVIHGAMAAMLLADWQPGVVAAPTTATLQTRLVTLSEPAPTVEPMAEPPAPLTPEPPPEPETVEPPPVVESAPEPEPDYAAIARKRAEEREREKLAEQRRLQEQRQAEQARLEQQRAEEARAEQQLIEQERLAAEHAAARQALQAQREAAANARQAAAAQSVSQYQPISKKAPAYPRRALNQKKEGDCVVEYTVTARGTVANPTVVEEACDPVFARPSLASASTFRYQPRIVDGQAVAVPGVRNTFRFRIENQQ